MGTKSIQQLAEDLVATCESFLKEDCGRVTASGMADPWLDSEESYKRMHSYALRNAVSWKDPKTYVENPRLEKLDTDFQQARVVELLASSGFDTRRLAKRATEVARAEQFTAMMNESAASSLDAIREAVAHAAAERQAAMDRIDNGTEPGARLRQLLDDKRLDKFKSIYTSAQTNSNLLVWSHCPPFDKQLAKELVRFIENNTDELDAASFRRFTRFLSEQPSPVRSKNQTLSPASVRTVATYWLFNMNPAKYLYLRTNGFARALAPDYPRKRGYFLEADDYSHVLDGCHALSEALASVGREWKPRDMIDLHTLLWFHLGEREDRKRRKAAKAVIPSAPVGVPYVEADETSTSAEADPFYVDPEKLDRGNRAHSATQNRLAAFLRGRGLVPLSPRPGDPEYDVAWWYGETLFVAEIKSTTELNSEKQLRLGIGQVLRYQHLLSERVPSVKAVLVPESEPDAGWQRFCSSLKVILTWPGDFAHLGFLDATSTVAVTIPSTSVIASEL